MQVVNFDPKAKTEAQRKENLLEVIDEMRRQIEQGEIKEFVACSINEDGMCQVHVSALDLPGAIGLFEIGKHQVITIETTFD